MLKGNKTIIRAVEEDDIQDLYQWYNDQEVNLWSSGAWPLNTLHNKEQIAAKFLDGGPDIYRYSLLTENEQLIGSIGFKDINVPARSVSIYIVIGNKSYWGKGYGTDALITFSRFLFTQWNFHRISLDTWSENTRAIYAYQKVGFKIEGRQREARFVLGSYHDSILMGLLRNEFLELHGTKDYKVTGNL
ncbi:acetyltransferase, ribosomal protein N-acetylase [Desulfosporosinus orientis DSM 765]|uniref:Acetyltransferase, ribosomal protein N-acetylase n=1 Tax=Desulfosporosinus orientis (strain ATCC 19365 / DSM 765 / NCIMB 8382 / VKM B-1628 / Singapore I) TaxID=768706 RepID=G7WBM2_DESOD|nr:GNAT family protein [Desulfosporosinus orientis]AET68780.1 acetyltransferase, ribosomal protein N-acetylase [Desulfosporosinus orientis DSM 765]